MWSFYIPAVKRTHDTDTAEFYPCIEVPLATTSTQLGALLDRIKELLEQPPSPQLAVTTDERLDAVINRLRTMYGMPYKDQPRGIGARIPPVKPPRVDPKVTTINTSQPKKKQRFRIGTRIRVKEKGATYIGKAINYDPHGGLYRIEFEDGEWDEFDDDEMELFQLPTQKPMPR